MHIINAKIDLSKIDKSKIFIAKDKTTGVPTGAKYYDVDIIINDVPNQYGQDTSISTSLSKEERDSKAKRSYLGNGKTVFKKADSPQPTAQDVGNQNRDNFSSAADNSTDDLPF